MADDKAAMSSYKAQVEQYGTPISEDQYKALRNYAEQNGVKLSGFKDFVGDIKVIQTVIDDIIEIAEDFPKILNEKLGICLELDYDMGTDYATTTNGHIIHLNAVFYSDLEMLEEDYQEGVRSGRFVRNTDWRAIIRHEVGHVVCSSYNLRPMDIALELMDEWLDAVLIRLMDELSIYSAEYDDGREVISECFSGYYSKSGSEFAEQYVKRCLDIVSAKGR